MIQLNYILVLFVLALIPMIAHPVFAQSYDGFIFVQNILRDGNGSLVTTHEVTKIGYINPAALDQFLAEEASQKDPIVTVGGQKMQVIERAITVDFDSKNVLSDTTLNLTVEEDKVLTLVRLIHDGIPVTSGDQMTTIWTFIRPV